MPTTPRELPADRLPEEAPKMRMWDRPVTGGLLPMGPDHTGEQGDLSQTDMGIMLARMHIHTHTT